MTKMRVKLYGFDKSRRVKVWECWTLPNGEYTIQHGLLDGKKQQTTKQAIPKNVGRANETTPDEQALIELNAAIEKKRQQGYDENLDVARDIWLPMLAHPYEKKKHKLKYPCFVQPKLDGVRCIAQRKGDKIVYLSRVNKPFTTLSHLDEDLLKILRDGERLDGEIYLHGVPLQILVSWVKKDQPDSGSLEYHVYDMPMENKRFSERLSFLTYAINKLSHKSPVKFVETWTCMDEDEVKEWFKVFVKRGYEGLIARNKAGGYLAGHRSDSLLKYKEFVTEEFEIIGATTSHTGREKGCVIWICWSNTNQEFYVRPKGTHKERRELYENYEQYVGKKLTVQYQALTEDGVPQFPVGIAIRDYE